MMEQRKEYRVVRLQFPPGKTNGEPTAFYAAPNGSSRHASLQSMLNDGWQIEREFKIFTKDECCTQKIVGTMQQSLVLDRVTEFEKTVACFVLSKMTTEAASSLAMDAA